MSFCVEVAVGLEVAGEVAAVAEQAGEELLAADGDADGLAGEVDQASGASNGLLSTGPLKCSEVLERVGVRPG